MRHLLRVVLLSTIAAAVAVPAVAQKFGAHVYQVPAGDVVVVKMRKRTVKIHLWGVAAPVSQTYSAQAKKRLGDLVLAKDVIVDVRSAQTATDVQAKILYATPPEPGKPFAASKPLDVNKELIAQGLGWWNPDIAPAATDLRDAQTAAKKAKKGLWADPNPRSPVFKTKPPVKQPDKPHVKPPAGPGKG